MKLVAVSVGMPQELDWRGRRYRTAIFKSPVAGPVAVHARGLEGDGQANRRVHGGVAKAVYAYPHEHYAFWCEELGRDAIEHGAFGENLTTLGLLEDAVRVGDRLRIGTVELVVTEPRIPCANLALRFERPNIVRRFLDSGRTGFYLSVAREGTLEAGDAIERLGSSPGEATIAELLATRGP